MLIRLIKLTWVNKKQEPYKRAQHPLSPNPSVMLFVFQDGISATYYYIGLDGDSILQIQLSNKPR